MSNCFNTNASRSLMYSVSKLKIMACFWGVIVGLSTIPLQTSRHVLVLLSVCKYHCNRKCIKIQVRCEREHVVNKCCLFTETSLGWESLAADPGFPISCPLNREQSSASALSFYLFCWVLWENIFPKQMWAWSSVIMNWQLRTPF